MQGHGANPYHLHDPGASPTRYEAPYRSRHLELHMSTTLQAHVHLRRCLIALAPSLFGLSYMPLQLKLST